MAESVGRVICRVLSLATLTWADYRKKHRGARFWSACPFHRGHAAGLASRRIIDGPRGSQSGSKSPSNAQSIRLQRIHQLSKVLAFEEYPGDVATWIKGSLADERYGKSRFGSVALDVGRTVASLSEQPCGKLPHTVRSAPLAANTWKAQSPPSIA